MVWLIVIQVSWFKEALTVRHQQFSQCVNRSLYRVVQKLEENEVVSHIQNEVIAVNFDSSSLGKPVPQLDRPGRVIADSMMRDTVGGKIVVLSRDSASMSILQAGQTPFPMEQTVAREEFQERVKAKIHNKTVFVENLVNQLIRKKINIEDRISPVLSMSISKNSSTTSVSTPNTISQSVAKTTSIISKQVVSIPTRCHPPIR